MMPAQVLAPYGMAWSPAPYAPPPPPSAGRDPKGLGEAGPVPFIDSPMAAFITDVTVMASSGLLAHLSTKGKSRWNVLFWVIAGVATFKGLADLSRLHQ